MEWIIEERQDGSFVARFGSYCNGGLSPTGIGYVMPYFSTYRLIRFDSKKAAEKYIKKNPKPL